MNGLKIRVDARLPAEIQTKLRKNNYDYEALRFANALLEANDRVLEVGAGIGVLAVTCAYICGEDNVTCYEANTDTAPLLKSNFRLNKMRPRLRQKAVATHAGVVDFFFNDDIVSSSLIPRQGIEATPVACDDIADIVLELDPNVIVMAAEGAEVTLLPHADLSGVEKLLLELHPNIAGRRATENLVKILHQRGFDHVEKAPRKNFTYFERTNKSKNLHRPDLQNEASQLHTELVTSSTKA